MQKKQIHVFKLPWSTTPFTKEQEERLQRDCETYMEPSEEEIEEMNRKRLEELNDPNNEIIVHDFTKE